MVHVHSTFLLCFALFAKNILMTSTTETTITLKASSEEVTTSATEKSATTATLKTATLTSPKTDATFTESVTKKPTKTASEVTAKPSKSDIPIIGARQRANSRYGNRTIFKWIDHKHAKLARERERDLAKQRKESRKGTKQKSKFLEEPVKENTRKHRHKNTKRTEDKIKPVQKKPCPECEMKQLKGQMEMNRKMSLKKQLLEKLKIDPTRNFRRPVIPTEILRQSLMEDESDVDDDGDAKTTDILVFGRDITNRCRYRKSTGCFKFNLRRKITGHITSAELYVYKLHDQNDGQQTIFLQELERPKHRKLMPRNIVSRVDTDITEGWLTFPLDKTVMRWTKEPLANDGIAIKCKTCESSRHNQLFSSKEGFKPFLVVHIQPIRQQRRHRRSVDCGAVVHTCCKHDFWVDFEDINLAQVIYPKGVWANYCTGPCGPLVRGHYNHTALLQDVRWRSESANNTIRNAVTPCCGAVRLKSITLLYVNDEGDITRADVPNLQLAECGCL